MKRKGTVYSLLSAIAILVGAGYYVSADTPETALQWTWTAPTTGTVAYYVGELDVNDAVTSLTIGPNTTWTMTYPDTMPTDVRLRVAGVDAQERVGQWSQWSEVYHDSGRPGAPGIPQGTVVTD